jgi:hypothetical protein
MANTTPKIQDSTFAMRADAEFKRDLEEWQRLCCAASKSDAVRIALKEAIQSRRRGSSRNDRHQDGPGL